MNRLEAFEKMLSDIKKQSDDYVKSATDEDFLHKDLDGNTSLHLAAYCGSDSIIGEILNYFSLKPKIIKELIMLENKYNETSLTLAIKRRGFHD